MSEQIVQGIIDYILDRTNLDLDDFVYPNEKFCLYPQNFKIRIWDTGEDIIPFTTIRSRNIITVELDIWQNKDADDFISDIVNELIDLFSPHNFDGLYSNNLELDINGLSVVNLDNENLTGKGIVLTLLGTNI